MINATQFLENVIIPTLDHLELNSKSAQVLLLGTALVESDLMHLVQIKGIAESFYQIEPNTANDIWCNYLDYRDDLADKVRALMIEAFDRFDQIDGNLFYATAMARIHYLRVPTELPMPENITELATYYKEHFNTHLGKSTVENSIHKFATAYEVVDRFHRSRAVL
jgi:hypothetical protein